MAITCKRAPAVLTFACIDGTPALPISTPRRFSSGSLLNNAIPKLSRTPGKVTHPGGALGEHNEDVWIGEMGLTRQEYDTLRAARVI